MNEHDLLKTSKDQLRIWKHSLEATSRWKRWSFKDVPPIFGNAFHKSGSHLLLQILYGVMDIAPYRHLEQAPVRMITAEGRHRSMQEIMHDLSKLKPGIIEWGYLNCLPEFVTFFEQNPQIAPLFIYRDPRDQLISSIFYAVDIHKQHAQHEFYASISMDERVKAAICGRDVPGLEFLPSIRVQYDRILGWLSNPGMLAFRFEDLINDPLAFSSVFDGLGAVHAIESLFIERWHLSPLGILVMMQISYLLMGMFLDDTAMLIIVAPLYVPLVIKLGYDAIWYGVLYTITCQIAYMTPPFGYNLFLMKAMAPPEVTLADIYRSIVPFVAVMIVGLAIVMLFPGIALWLPHLYFAR